jgi:16S rRNA (cytosine967-C5)-methyltransferase
MTPKAIQDLLPQQQALLDGLVPLLAPGGRLVYATCTMHPAENGEQMANLLSRCSELTLEREQQRWPDAEEGGDGFYAAVLQRVQRRS